MVREERRKRRKRRKSDRNQKTLSILNEKQLISCFHHHGLECLVDTLGYKCQFVAGNVLISISVQHRKSGTMLTGLVWNIDIYDFLTSRNIGFNKAPSMVSAVSYRQTSSLQCKKLLKLTV